MTYIPQTQWIGGAAPMRPKNPEAPKKPRLRLFSKHDVTRVLTGADWMTAAQLARALGKPSTERAHIIAVERSLRKMAGRGVIARQVVKTGGFLYGAAK